MSFSIRQLVGGSRSGRRVARAVLGVELMEGRALLTTAAVTAAVASVQAELVVNDTALAAEATILQSNALAIESASATFTASTKADLAYREANLKATPANATIDNRDIAYDKALIKNIARDEKFALAQQANLMKTLDKDANANTKTLNGTISGLNKGTISPTTISATLTANTTKLNAEIAAIDVQATHDVNGLLGTFAAGKA
jgi:hypothetical protein